MNHLLNIPYYLLFALKVLIGIILYTVKIALVVIGVIFIGLGQGTHWLYCKVMDRQYSGLFSDDHDTPLFHP